MKRLAVVFVCISSSGCASINEYLGPGWEERQDRNPDTKFVLAETAWHALNVVDTMQTVNIANNPECYREVGFPSRQLVGSSPSKKDAVAVGLLYSVGYRLVSNWMARKQEHGQDSESWRAIRSTWHFGNLIVKAFVVGRNHANGLTPLGQGCP